MQENEYEGLDEMFKSGLENSRISPPPGVWEGVAAGVAGTGAGVGAGIGIFSKVILGVAVSAGLGVGAYFYVQGQKEQPQLPKENKQEIVAAPAQQEDMQADPMKTIEDQPRKIEFVAPVVPIVRDEEAYGIGDDPEWIGGSKDDPGYSQTTIERNTQVEEPIGIFEGANPGVSSTPCAHKASISSSQLADNRFLFTLNAPDNAGNITWYVNGVSEYAGEANSRSLDRTFTEAGPTFAVMAKIRSGNCWDSAVERVKIVVPEEPKLPSLFAMPYNVITPNGDGLNDDLFLEIANQEYFELNVYDKNKVQVFRSTSPDARWTGKCGMNDCPVGTYLAVVKYRFKGESDFRVKRMYIKLTR